MSANQTQIDRLMKDIAKYQQADAREAKKEADLLAKINGAQQSISRTKILSTIRTKSNEIVRVNKQVAAVQKKRASNATKVADYSKKLRSYQDRQARDDEKTRKKIAGEQKKLIREREAHERKLSSEIQYRATMRTQTRMAEPVSELHDFFISHASEDKDTFVRELAEMLKNAGAKVWYDEFTLKVGDSLRRNIDNGLASSKFGVVILSDSFFKKEWPNRELDGLVSLEVQGRSRILPIWHKVSKDEVARYSPTLADKVALNTSLKTVREIANELMSLIDDH